MRVDTQTKKCADCRLDKSLDSFHRQPSGRSGRHTYCKGCYSRRYKNRKRVDAPSKRSNRNYLIRYGLTSDQVCEKIAAQGNQCLICEKALLRPCVDHCHKTGRVRGILCYRCNFALGVFERDDFARKAAEYLARFK